MALYPGSDMNGRVCSPFAFIDFMRSSASLSHYRLSHSNALISLFFSRFFVSVVHDPLVTDFVDALVT